MFIRLKERKREKDVKVKNLVQSLVVKKPLFTPPKNFC